MPNNATKKCPYCAEEILAAAVKCKHCGSDLGSISTASTEKAGAAKVLKSAVGIIAVTLLVIWLANSCNGPSSPPVQGPKMAVDTPPSPPPPPSEPVAPPPPEIPVPATESKLIAVASTAQNESKSAANDMQRGGFKNKRDKAVCALMMNRLRVSGWVGKIEKIDANSDGKGVLSIAIAPDILVATWNNELSDDMSGDKTLMDPNSPLFAKVSALKQGQIVSFAGTFFKPMEGEDGSDCIQENSITLEGKLSQPEFVFRFDSVNVIP